MKAEHCDKDNSKAIFTTRNYGISTCARDEWQFVVDKDSTDVSYPVDMRHDRKISEIEELCKVPLSAEANLSRVEVIAVVLYTGPMVCMYVVYVCMYVCSVCVNICSVCVNVCMLWCCTRGLW